MTDEEILKGSNDEQKRAILTAPDTDVVITAGAGSGKTATLTKKVFRYIDQGMIKPSELLVLTFTNNAAHEMKTRIIGKFKDGSEYAKQILSAHVQTFDSFFQYLVSTYSGELGISEKISIVSEDAISAKRNKIVDDIFDEYYKNNKDLILKTLQKFNIRDDSKTKQVVLEIEKQLSGFIPEKKNAFLISYKENFLNRAKFDENLTKYLNGLKEKIKKIVVKANFIEKHYDELYGDDISLVNSLFSNPHAFNDVYDALHFDYENADILYKALLKLIKMDGDEFLENLINFSKNNAELLKSKRSIKADKKAEQSGFFSMKDELTSKDGILNSLDMLDESYEKCFEKLDKFGDDIKLILDIVAELENRLTDYKKITNSFDFSDISLMAYDLLTKEKYARVAHEIRNRFRYIMVDEYQDTNDIQEAILESLTSEGNSHIFCVGDAKQSIYKFRNANVDIIRDRQKRYYEANNAKKVVIPMNKNYRSGKLILDDINYLFNSYMTLNHGSIDYSDPQEQLTYDPEVNIYGKPFNNFGIFRLMPKPGTTVYDAATWEALAIANDIKNKINEGYEVYSRDTINGSQEGPRKCRYSDFAIIVRTKRESRTFMEIFSKYNIPLNLILDTDLLEIDAIIVIQSLFSLIGNAIFGISVDKRHLFASVARSYLYQYTDQQVHECLLLSDEELANDQLMKDINNFAETNKNKPLSELYLNMISDFKIVEKLYLIGNVEDNISKIEMLNSIILTQTETGEGIEDFIGFIKTISKYELKLGSKSSSMVENAVDLMTIHASKGLERKVVYMPCSSNKLAAGNNSDAADYSFSKKYGIILPDYEVNNEPLIDEEDNEIYVRTAIYNAYDLIMSNEADIQDPDVDEHVRYFYVALTRAECTLYIVGSAPEFDSKEEKSASKSETLYGMMNSTCNYPTYNEQFINKKIAEGWVEKPLYDGFLSNVEILKNRDGKAGSLKFDSELAKNLYTTLYQEVLFNKARSNVSYAMGMIDFELFNSYLNKCIIPNINNVDLSAKIYAKYTYGVDVENVQELMSRVEELNSKIDNDALYKLNKNECFYKKESGDINEFLRNYMTQLNECNCEFFNINITTKIKEAFKDKQNVHAMAEKFLKVLASVFDAVEVVSCIKYSYERFNQNIEYFDINTCEEFKSKDLPDLYEVDINNEVIEFKERKYSRASKIYASDIDSPVQWILTTGVRLHKLLELVDFKTKDTSFIKNSKDKKLVDDLLKNEIFSDLSNAVIYKEYGYYDEEINTTGFIDLLIVKDNEYFIVDYKTKHIDDEDYDKQLETYERNVRRIFKLDKSRKVHLALLSIVDNKLRILK